ncbi:recombinase family protein, partial [Enterococcus gallinarum]|uniref:recombinase family protein n=1 Tax=Enterococcus gallinarum TaxID=1353 RepID=UPI001EEE08C7
MYNTKFFVDDGYSGTNFNRPGFQEALDLVNNGVVKNFVVKDLSRFGRSYAEVALYTEILFPKLDVRFIAVNDGVDSETQDANEIDFAPFRNVFNEFYAKDTSKKIRAVQRTKGLAGERLAVIPPFGYTKDPNDRNHLLVDEEASKVVQKIFDYCI